MKQAGPSKHGGDRGPGARSPNVAVRTGVAIGTFLTVPWRPLRHDHPAWTREMSLIALGFLVAGALLALFDAVLLDYARGNPAALFGFARVLTDLGKSEWYLVPSLVLLFALGSLNWRERSARARARLAFLFGQAGFAFAAVALSGILVNIVKVPIGRARPILFDEGGAFQFQPFSVEYAHLSFPSGHSTTCGALAMVVILWFPRWWVVWAIGMFAIAATRVPAGAHYPSDVVAGFGLGLLFTLWFGRWLALRGAAFRVRGGRLLPVMRHARAWVTATRAR